METAEGILSLPTYPNVKAYASTPASRNSISNVRSSMEPGLPEQLIQPLLVDCAISLLVHVGPVRGARGFAIDEHPEANTRTCPGLSVPSPGAGPGHGSDRRSAPWPD